MIVCRQCRRTSRAQDMCNCFFPDPLGIVFAVNDRLAEHPLARGNLHRTAGRVPSYVSFRTSAHAGVGISIVIVTAFF